MSELSEGRLSEGAAMLNANELYQLLLNAYGKPRWWSDDPFIVMFQAVLVQNTAWGSVEKTCSVIGDRLTPERIEALPVEELEKLIRPCGFYKAKSHTIKAILEWYRQYHFEQKRVCQISASRLRKELLAIRGVGAETADVILVYAFYKPSFIIDAYTRRFLSRMGYSFADDDSIRYFFQTSLPGDAEVYGWYHWLILDHCISACRKKPECEGCLLRSKCRQCL